MGPRYVRTSARAASSRAAARSSSCRSTIRFESLSATETTACSATAATRETVVTMLDDHPEPMVAGRAVGGQWLDRTRLARRGCAPGGPTLVHLSGLAGRARL